MLYISKSSYDLCTYFSFFFNFWTSWKSWIKEQWSKKSPFWIFDSTSWLVPWGYIWYHQFLKSDQVHKGHTKLKMLTVFGEQILGWSSKQTKLNFSNRLHPKNAYLCRFLTKTVTWWQNRKILTLCVIEILNAMNDTVFFGCQLRGGSEFFYLQWGLSLRKSILWLTG